MGVDPSRDVELHRRLLTRIGRGDLQAFEQLYHLFAKPLYALIWRMLGNAEEAEEVLQDLFIVIWNRAMDYNPELSRPFSWMIVITRRLCWNKLRTRTRHQRKLDALGVAGELADVNPSPAPDPGQTVEREEMSEKLREQVDRFPLLQRQVIEAALFDGMTHEEIADATKVPLGTVKTWIRRGMMRIKSEIKEQS